ncbi:MAG: carbon-nitrogen hydrolase family protein [Erythrobacter sp.]|nr:MAG: carbon-nitrogen hydrolase family protein [Erythrobacter sp.]
MVRVALLQMTSGIDPEANLAAIDNAAKEAAENDAQILFLPEMALLLDRNRKRAAEWIESPASEDMIGALEYIATAYMIDLAVGSLPVSTSHGKWANRSLYIGHMALLEASYDKMHMFDVELATGESWRESSAYRPGEEVVTVENTPIGRLGLTICYDIRFPALFDELGRRECDAIAIPAAFTVPTGKAHWHLLQRARAVEASAFVIAAAQVGLHADGRQTYGHSLVVDPWGEVLLDMGGDAPGLGVCDIDLGRIAKVRRQLPSLANKRDIPTAR